MTSHFAISIEKPAIPRAPSIYAINANTKSITASPIKSAIFYSPYCNLTNISYNFVVGIWIRSWA